MNFPYYDFYQFENVKNEDIPKTFEAIFKFPKSELDFVPQDIKLLFHYRYFANYIFYDDNGLKAKTVVVEKHYTCLTFLEDYINYYAHCYTKYDKNCRRIHLFNENFNQETFQNMIYYGNEGQYTKFWESYLGCIVIKPLPTGIIGVTYLKTYIGDEERNRHYTAINNQTINLYGTLLKVNTMPFIEQDSKVGSCASVALWMAFQKTSELFHTKKPSPSEITLLAGSDSYNTGKIFPSKGLAVNQICKAIYDNGLHSEFGHSRTKVIDRNLLQGFVYAYLKAEIPILLGIEIENVGSHLITLNGYRFKFENEKIIQDIDYKSQFISKFYAHDDQTGPFFRLKFNKGVEEYFLRTSWWKSDIDWDKPIQEIKKYFKEENNYYNCKPTCLIVPLDRKIKVTYEEIVDKIEIIKCMFSDYLTTNFIWDVFLIKSNAYKEQIKKQVVEQKENLHELLHKSLPQYIWVAQAYIHESYEEPIFDFIFDSVEMPYDGKPFLTNIYSKSFKNNLSQFDIQIQKLFGNAENTENTAYDELLMRELLQKENHNIAEQGALDKAIDDISKALDDIKPIL